MDDARGGYRAREGGMGLGGLVVRAAAIGLIGWAAFAGGSWVVRHLNGSDAPIEQGFVNYKSLERVGKKNASGSMEAYLQYKHGDRVDSLPCMEGYSGGVVCGAIDYLVENMSPAQKEGVVVGQFQSISNDAKRGIVDGELQSMLDTFYGTQKAQQKPQAQYNAPKK